MRNGGERWIPLARELKTAIEACFRTCWVGGFSDREITTPGRKTYFKAQESLRSNKQRRSEKSLFRANTLDK